MKRNILLSLLLCLSLTSCAPTPKTAPQKAEDLFVVGTTMKIDAAVPEDYNFSLLSGVFSHIALFKLDEKGEAIPFLATDYETTDGKTFLFSIREDLKWQNGAAVTAQDVAYTLEKEKFAAKQVNAVGTHMLEIVLERPNNRLPMDLVTMRIYPQDGSTMGCGPYALESFDKAAGLLTYKANAQYPDGAPKFKTVVVKLFSNTDTLYMALQNGEIQMPYIYSGGVEPKAAEQLKMRPNLTTQTIADAGVNLLYFNTQKAPASDLNVRRAVAYAIDYHQFATFFGSSYALAPNSGIIPPSSAYFVETPPLKRDIEAARAALKASGLESVELEFLVRSDKAIYARMGELLQANLAEAGMTVRLRPMDAAQFRTATEQERSHTAMISRATPWGMVMKSGLGMGYMDSRANGLANINDPAFSKLADDMYSASAEHYAQLGQQVQQYYSEQLPAIPLFWDHFIQVYDNRFSNFTIDGTFGLLNFDSWISLEIAERG